MSHLPGADAQEAGGAYPADPEARAPSGQQRFSRTRPLLPRVLLPGVVSTGDTATGGEGTRLLPVTGGALPEAWRRQGLGLPVAWASAGQPETVKEASRGLSSRSPLPGSSDSFLLTPCHGARGRVRACGKTWLLWTGRWELLAQRQLGVAGTEAAGGRRRRPSVFSPGLHRLRSDTVHTTGSSAWKPSAAPRALPVHRGQFRPWHPGSHGLQG